MEVLGGEISAGGVVVIAGVVKPAYFVEHAVPKATFASLAAVINTFFGLCSGEPSGAFCTVAETFPKLLLILMAMQFLDMVGGTLASRSAGERVTSRRGMEGVKRKLAILLMVAAAALLDQTFTVLGFPTRDSVFVWTTAWFIGVEAISLYENSERAGIPLPTFLKQVIEWLLQRAGEKRSIDDNQGHGPEDGE